MTLLVIAAIGYFAVNVAQVGWAYYTFLDRMRSEAIYAPHRTDTVIRRRLADLADSLNLPESAQNIQVRRTPHAIFIWADYSAHIELPGFVYELHLSPQATGAF
ncbi:MAG: hypothetical protein HYR75_05425 [Gemmatimonadetes bacterium]|nr:hypothetical protein [Gemmatimonadota bacterium]MBI3567435.1 hypothetical protein [Gemmatimonadota bacterium]